MHRVLLECAAGKDLSRLSTEIHTRVRPAADKLSGSKYDWRIREATTAWIMSSPTKFASCASTACATGAKFIADKMKKEIVDFEEELATMGN